MSDLVVPHGALVVAWAVLLGVAVWARRPHRAPTLPAGPDATAPTRADGPLARAGWAVRRRLPGAEPAAAHPSDRLLGAGLLVAPALLVAAPPLAPLPPLAGLLAGVVARRREALAGARAAQDALPDAVDLLSVAVTSGLALGPALALVAPHLPPPLGPALAAADLRLAHGAPVDEALAPLAVSVPPAAPLVALLVAAHVDGAPLADALARLSDETRAARRRAVEARARQVPVRMLFPLVLCTLPAFVLLTIVPPIVAALGDLRT